MGPWYSSRIRGHPPRRSGPTYRCRASRVELADESPGAMVVQVPGGTSPPLSSDSWPPPPMGAEPFSFLKPPLQGDELGPPARPRPRCRMVALVPFNRWVASSSIPTELKKRSSAFWAGRPQSCECHICYVAYGTVDAMTRSRYGLYYARQALSHAIDLLVAGSDRGQA